MEQIYDIVIVGSGPAGMAAAIYGQRAGLSLIVLESSYVMGGQIQNTYEVDNYPGLPGIGGMDLADRLKEHAQAAGASFVQGRVTRITEEGDIYILHTKKAQYRTRSVILASGASHRVLGVPGEEALSGMGVSYCATCDGAFFKDRTVAVIGGGDTAVEDALLLARTCKKVYLVHRRDSLRAAEILQKRLVDTENIEMRWSCTVDEIMGEDQVEQIRLHSVNDDTEEKLPVDGVFVAVGITPNTEFVEGLVALDENGYIIAGEDTKTSRDGIFAAGDIRTKQLRQIITAAADGANAVTAVQTYLLSES